MLKDKIIEMLKEWLQAKDATIFTDDIAINQFAKDIEPIVNQEVERRIAKRMPKSDVDRIIELIHQAEEMPFVTARFGDNWKNHAKNEYTFEDVIHIAWKQGRRAILLERELRSRLTNDSQKTEQTPQATPQVPRKTEGGGE